MSWFTLLTDRQVRHFQLIWKYPNTKLYSIDNTCTFETSSRYSWLAILSESEQCLHQQSCWMKTVFATVLVRAQPIERSFVRSCTQRYNSSQFLLDVSRFFKKMTNGQEQSSKTHPVSSICLMSACTNTRLRDHSSSPTQKSTRNKSTSACATGDYWIVWELA